MHVIKEVISLWFIVNTATEIVANNIEIINIMFILSPQKLNNSTDNPRTIIWIIFCWGVLLFTILHIPLYIYTPLSNFPNIVKQLSYIIPQN